MYATSFFDLVDQRGYVEKLIIPCSDHIFDNQKLVEVALEYVDVVDYIIFTSDVDTSCFPKEKVIGNYDTKYINNKYDLYKKLSKDFLLPETYKLDSVDEALEIVENNPSKKYITKPIYGFGGRGIEYFNKDHIPDGKFLLQEYVEGDNVSSSFIAYPDHEVEMITTSEQIIGSNSLGSGNFIYCGNITPFVKFNEKINNISTKTARMLKLVGSCGIDFVLSKNRVYVIEVNPRIQGTFECIENSFNINLAKFHIDACNNIQVKLPKPERFSVKLIPYCIKRGRYPFIANYDIRDVSNKDYIFNKNEPIATIISCDQILENAMIKAQYLRNQIYSSYESI